MPLGRSARLVLPASAKIRCRALSAGRCYVATSVSPVPLLLAPQSNTFRNAGSDVVVLFFVRDGGLGRLTSTGVNESPLVTIIDHSAAEALESVMAYCKQGT
jgi:hypothetical protein